MYTADVLLPTYTDVVIVRLNATDADTADFTRLRYSIESGNVGNRFRVDADSGVLTLREGATEVDGMQDQYELTVGVTDGTFSSQATVRIAVRALESSGLRFTMPEFEAEVAENHDMVEHVALLPVVGRALNEHVTFALLNAGRHFSVHRTSGVVRTTGVAFDRELRDRYVVVVEARDERTPARVAHTQLHVHVIDVNDNAPVFVHQPYFAMVAVDAPVGSIVKKVNRPLLV